MASMGTRERPVPSPIQPLSLVPAPLASIPSSDLTNSMPVRSSPPSATQLPPDLPAKTCATCASSSPKALDSIPLPGSQSPVENRIIFPFVLDIAALGLVRASKTKTQDRSQTPRHSRCCSRSQSLHRHGLQNYERLFTGQRTLEQ